MKNMKRLQLLLVGMLLIVSTAVRAQDDPIVLELYCYGQVTASVADGHSGRGVVCASLSSDAPETGSADWNTKVVQSEQYLPIRQSDVAGIMSALAGMGIEMNLGPTTYSVAATMAASPLYVHAGTAKDGYYFEGWKDKKGVIVSSDPDYPEPTFAVKEGWNVRTEPYAEDAKVFTEMGPLYASFPHLEIGAASGELVIHPTNADYKTYTVYVSVPHADSQSDFSAVELESLTGDGTFGISSWSCYDGTVEIQYAFYLEDGRPGVSTAQLRMRTKGGESEKIFKIRANYTNIASGNAPLVVCAPGAPVNATATFATQYAEYKSKDFPRAPTFADSKWSVTSYSYGNNEVRVNYTFNASGLAEGTYETTLTLTTSAGVSKTIPVTAIVENASATDAVVLNASGTQLSTGSLADAITYANAHADAATIEVKRNVALAAALPAITRSITIDLKGRTISNTIASRTPSLTIGDGTNNPTVTLADSRVGGTISHTASVAGELVTVDVVKGKLSVAGGKITANNTYDDVSASTIALNVQSAAQAEIQSAGVVQTVTAKNNAVGINSIGALEVKGGTISANAASTATAVFAQGTCSIHAGTITATVVNDQATAIQVGASASLTVKDGTITANAATMANAVYSQGNAVIDKGEFVATADNAAPAYAFCLNGAGKTAQIKGGKYSASVSYEPVANVLQQAGTLSISGGIYTVDTNLASLATAAIRGLNPGCADYNANYRYAVGDNPNAVVARIDEMYFPSLVSALSYVNNNPSLVCTIVLMEDEHLAAGKYTLPAKATLLIPYSEEQTAIDVHPERETSYETPSCFRTLTLEAGARLDVYGKLQVGSRQCAQGQLGGNNGAPTGSYGKISMQEGSTITVESDAHLYAWGFIVGQGSIDVKRGGTVHEMMQIKDWRGGQATFSFNDNMYKVFPLNQYYIQNIEVKATFRPGSKELIDGLVNAMGMTFPFTDVLLIGGNGQKCMFSMDLADISEDTWVRKWYDAANDKQVYDINNSAQVSSLVLTLNVMIMSVSFNSALYVLPLTNNMKIHLLTGTLGITQDVLLTPGAEIEVDKEATAYIVEGKKLFVMDADEWMPFAPNVNIYPVAYSPSWTSGCPRHRQDALEDAKINVHGTFQVDGSMFTTENGASIFSTNADAGTFLINNAAPGEDDEVYLANNTLSDSETDPNYQKRVAVPALLRNGDATFAETRGAEAGRTYAYYNDHWRNWKTEGCFAIERVGDEDIYYAKPADYVALAAGTPDAADHLYHSADMSRTFILMDDCQWWEVNQVQEQEDLYYCAKNNVYYFYDEAADVPQWKEKLLTVRWYDSDGETLLNEYTNVHYGDKAQYFHDDPVKAPDGYKTYDFIGWLPEPAENLTSDASYVAQYQENIKECTIKFRDADGELIEQKQVAIGTIPVCSGAPAGVGELYDWYPPIHAVTSDEEYMLVAREIKEYYELTFLDWNNSMLLTISDIPAGKSIAAAPDGSGDYYLTIEDETNPIKFAHNPSKPDNAGRQYTLTGWSPALAVVKSDAIYTAVYAESKKKFAITLNASAGGSVSANVEGTGADSNEYEYGTELTLTATPATGYYLKQWQDSLVAASRTITVTGAATYSATFSNTYNVKLNANGGEILRNAITEYNYNADGDIALPGRDDVVKSMLRPLGWYTKADFSDEPMWSIPAGTAKNLVLYMKWGDASQEEFTGQNAYYDTNLGGYYSTFYSSASNYEVPAGYTAYKAVIEGEYIHLRAIGDIIPAGEGVLLYSEYASTFDLYPTSFIADNIGHNDFTGTDDGVGASDIYAAGNTPYVFSAVDNVVGFYKLRSTASIPAHKAYVIWQGGNSAPPRMLRFADRPGVATGIDNMENEPVRMKGVYSILGHELTEPVHGTVNIIDGELKYIP